MRKAKPPYASFPALNQAIVDCELCPRLREHCLEVARVKRKAYRDQTYWGLPVPGFGDPKAKVLLVGLAPGAHGANRTGRVFTGDKSADFLFEALHRTGFANQPTSVSRADGLVMHGAYISCAARCAPPDNKPLPDELSRCQPFLEAELRLLPQLRAVVCLGKIGFETWLKVRGLEPASRFHFAHGAQFDESPAIFCSYHPSQQNTQTGRLTMDMLVEVFTAVRQYVSH